MKKLLVGLLTLSASVAFSANKQPSQQQPGVVNFTQCVLESKCGKEEQRGFEKMRKQMLSMMDETDKELQSIAKKLEDPEQIDSLSPKAKEDLEVKRQALQEDLGRYQNQYYQAVNQAQYQLVQKLSSSINKAAEKVAKEKGLPLVVNKEACFYFAPSLEITEKVIQEMDNEFDMQVAKDSPQKNEVAVKEEAKDKNG